uniref:Splicing factor U2AF 26 kDa subunit n=1 Tax=Chelydra serpentina TaxID=8475 RepID=A0A8C3SKW0_CHESE
WVLYLAGEVNCSFYFKIGACRHGDRCSRLHNKPTFSQTIVLLNLYRNPQNTAQSADGTHCHVSDVEVQEHYDNFFEEVFTELEEKYGEIEEMNICDNLGDHLVGNVYVKFRREEDAERAMRELNNRWFSGQAVRAELSPVTDFRESCCRQYEMGEFCVTHHLHIGAPNKIHVPGWGRGIRSVGGGSGLGCGGVRAPAGVVGSGVGLEMRGLGCSGAPWGYGGERGLFLPPPPISLCPHSSTWASPSAAAGPGRAGPGRLSPSLGRFGAGPGEGHLSLPQP